MRLEICREIAPDEALQRVADGLAAGAIADLGRMGDDAVGAVHECRRKVRAARAVVRLRRRELGDESHAKGAALLREAAGLLSRARDAHVVVQAFDRLSGHLDAAHQEAARAIRPRLDAGRDGLQDLSAAACLRLGQFREWVSGWPVGTEGYRARAEEVGEALRRSTRRMRRRAAAASRRATPETLHELRKCCKDLRDQLRILLALKPRRYGRLERRLDEVCGLLGEERDLLLLGAALDELAQEGGAAGECISAVQSGIKSRRRELRAAALRASERAARCRPRRIGRAIAENW